VPQLTQTQVTRVPLLTQVSLLTQTQVPLLTQTQVTQVPLLTQVIQVAQLVPVVDVGAAATRRTRPVPAGRRRLGPPAGPARCAPCPAGWAAARAVLSDLPDLSGSRARAQRVPPASCSARQRHRAGPPRLLRWGLPAPSRQQESAGLFGEWPSAALPPRRSPGKSPEGCRQPVPTTPSGSPVDIRPRLLTDTLSVR